MTLGARIAALRKEKGLSQEALGEQVGVSRQAVSKWESDRALPDVNNCVAMSRVFGVTLSQLLGLEDAAAPEQAAAHLQSVQELVDAYEDARKKARRRWRWPVLLVACALAVGVAWLWEWLSDMNRTIDYLHGEIAGLRSEIISGVGDRVEDTLAAQGSPLESQLVEILSADLWKNTVTVRVEATLKEAAADTVVQLLLREAGAVPVEMTPLGGLRYGAELICPIRDEPIVDVVIKTAGISRSKALVIPCFAGDYRMDLGGYKRSAALELSGLKPGAREQVSIWLAAYHLSDLTVRRAEVLTLLNDQPVAVYPLELAPGEEEMHEWELDLPVELPRAQAGDLLTFAVFAEDNYDRRLSYIISRYRVEDGGALEELPEERDRLNDGTYGLEVWE